MGRLHANFTLEPHILDELDSLAEEEGESRSEIVNRLLMESLARREKARFVQAVAEAGVGTASLVLIVHMGQLLLLAGL